MNEDRGRRWRSRTLGVGMVAGALIVAGCGGGGSKSSSTPTGANTATAALKRLEVQVSPGASAAILRQTFLAQLGDLVLGGPRAAEAATGLANSGRQGLAQPRHGRAPRGVVAMVRAEEVTRQEAREVLP